MKSAFWTIIEKTIARTIVSFTQLVLLTHEPTVRMRAFIFVTLSDD
jgi:hypothetical protein